jgi:dUTP pyrophosphatase
MQLKVKRLVPEAALPTKAHSIDAGFDLVATSKTWDDQNQVLVFGTGVAVAIPVGYVGLLVPRSSVYKTGLSLANSVGVIDSGYQGEVKVVFSTSRARANYNIGDRVAQLVVVPLGDMNVLEVNELEVSTRNTGGFGSTGV